MVQYQAELDGAFAALADPTRRAILERLGRGAATISELAEPFGMTLTGMKKHVGILEGAGLLSTEKIGRSRQCSLGPRRLEDVQAWIEQYRRVLDGRLDRLGELLEEDDDDKGDAR
ncbi:MAG TPA: metalloregulator ArsR/SmtB family transcription factor [Solirubrobacteraceae bacterium]|jgi:DNA-binding transcriptional ArsR family regulator|nr:metalloregulator ArsR/SmtB family transcription factor [Solirubrobacteraceae bacterium]